MVYIIIINFNNWRDTALCIEGLIKLHFLDFKIVVVNNGTEAAEGIELMHIKYYEKDEFDRSISQHWEKLNLVRTENRGYGAAVNTVLQKLMNESGYAWLLNPDIIVEPGTLTELMRCAGNNDEKTVFGCKVFSATLSQKVFYLGGYRVNRWTGTISFITEEQYLAQLQAISGGCLFAPLKAFKDVGFFPEGYFLYWEDTEWCFMAREKNYRLKACLKAICYDKGSTTIGKGFMADYYYTHNGLHFLRKFYLASLPSAVAANIGRTLKRIGQGRFKNAQAILFSTLHFIIGRKPNADRLLAKYK